MKKIGVIFISFSCVVLTMCTPPDNPFQDTGNVNLHIEVLEKTDGFKYCINDKVSFKVTVLFSHLVKKISIHFDENADRDEQEFSTEESEKVILFDYVYKEKGKKNVEFTIQFREGEEKDTTIKIDIGVKPEIKNLIVGDNRKPGKSLTITVEHVKFSTARYEWYKNSKILPGQDQQSLIFNPLKESDEGRYHCIVFTDWGKDQSKPFDLSLKNKTDAPRIQDHPRSIQTTTGNKARFIIKAKGTNLRYQWFRDGDTIENAIQASLETGPVSREDDGKNYHCIVSNDKGEEVSNKATLTVIKIPKPRILEHPGDTAVLAGTTVMFSVNAEGKNLIYQWLKNGEEINGATEQSYIVKEATLTDNGKKFSCSVSNSTGQVNSKEAILTVKEIPGPKIVEQPKNQEVTEGENARFIVVSEGGDLTFKWQKNQKNISGATVPEYIYQGAKKEDNGAEFRCIVANDYGSDTSKTATLTVNKINNPPIWKQELVDVETKEGIEVSVDLLKYFDKDPDGDQVTFIKKSGPGLIESNGKIWSWIPNFNSSSPTPAECVITAKDNGNPGMSGNMTISVTVIDSVCGLNLSVTSGKGKITTDPSGPDFTPGTRVKITAVPEKDYILKSWSGDIINADPTSSSIQITMDANKSLSAIFVKAAETVVLNIGESYVCGLNYINGYYFASTRTRPAKLLRFNANDLSDYSEITFSTNLNTADDLVYAEKTRKIYVVFSADTGLRIAEVDPYTMKFDEDKIVDMTNFTYSGQTITTDNEFLYVGARSDWYKSKIIKYSLSTPSNTPAKEITLAPLHYGIHAIQYRNGYLYVTGTAIPPWVLKINTNTLSVEQEANIDGQTPSDDFALTKDYLFVGLETRYNHRKSGVIYRISTDDISKMYPINTGVKGSEKKGSGYCFAVQFCLGYVWALFSTKPGVLTRIDPVSLDFQNFQLEHNSPNEISTDGRRLFITYWGQNPGRIQAIDPSYLNGREIP